MSDILARALGETRSLSVLGICKNAGKTTVLNRLIHLAMRDGRALAVTSIGRDGEAVDTVYGTAKPGVWIYGGTLVATAEGLLRCCDVTREILHTTRMYTPLGEVVLFRALSDGFVQLAGPSITKQMIALTELFEGFGAGLTLMDGALSRKSLGAPAVSGSVILCAGASYHPDMERVVSDTAYACRLLMLPAAGVDHGGRRLLSGAVTDGLVTKLAPKAGDELVAEDSSRILLSRALFERLLSRGVRISVLHPTKLCCVCVNPFSAGGVDFDKDLFTARMAEAVPVPVVNVEEHGND